MATLYSPINYGSFSRNSIRKIYKLGRGSSPLTCGVVPAVLKYAQATRVFTGDQICHGRGTAGNIGNLTGTHIAAAKTTRKKTGMDLRRPTQAAQKGSITANAP